MAAIINPEKEVVVRVGELMCIAARTAPKACGIDHLVTALLWEQEDRARLAATMRELAAEFEAPFFARDAQNLEDAQACVLIGTRFDRMHIPGCDLCGFADCAESEAAGARCAFKVTDLGIALGSAAALAADHRVDCRIMYTVGKAALRLGLLGAEVEMAHGLPLSATGKNIFFDRKAPTCK